MEHYAHPEGVKLDNLLKMADFIEKVPQRKFTMENFRGKISDFRNFTCRSIGCIIGHCIILDDYANIPFHPGTAYLDFESWSVNFTGISSGMYSWYYLFSCSWKRIDNTPEGAAKRIRYYVKNGLPFNWRKQLEGSEQLSYNQ